MPLDESLPEEWSEKVSDTLTDENQQSDAAQEVLDQAAGYSQSVRILHIGAGLTVFERVKRKRTGRRIDI